MPDITLNIHTADGNNEAVEAPPDMAAGDFLADIINHLNLATQDAEGHRISWSIVDKDINTELKLDETLEINGVRHDHHLYVRRKVVAGVSAEAVHPGGVYVR